MKKLFTNIIVVNAKFKTVRSILEQPKNLLQWVPDVNNVTVREGNFLITRNQSALNQSESLRITSSLDTITYISTGGRLEYELQFKLTEQGDDTLVEQTLLIDKSTTHLPLTLLTPITKHAFYGNLENLSRVATLAEN